MEEELETKTTNTSVAQHIAQGTSVSHVVNEINAVEEDEIDLVEVLKTVWEGRSLIFKSVIACALIGLIVALTSPKEYETGAKLIPESSEGGMDLGGLGGLASLAGINMGSAKSGASAIPPELYPEVIKSVEFQRQLIYQKFFFENENSEYNAITYFKEKAPRSLISNVFSIPRKVLALWKSENQELVNGSAYASLVRLNKSEIEAIKSLEDRISVSVDEKSGIISLDVKMPDPVAAAQLANYTLNYLQHYVTTYKISKQQQTVDFISKQYSGQKEKFEKAQEKLALFNDRNRNVVTNIARTEQQRLQNQYSFAFEIYKGLTQQLEQSKIKLKEVTPIFTILDPIEIPFEKSSPKRALIMIVSVFLGGVLGVGLIFVKNLYQNIKSQW